MDGEMKGEVTERLRERWMERSVESESAARVQSPWQLLRSHQEGVSVAEEAVETSPANPDWSLPLGGVVK